MVEEHAQLSNRYPEKGNCSGPMYEPEYVPASLKAAKITAYGKFIVEPI